MHYQGDPGRLRPAQVNRLKQVIAKGAFHNAEQVRTWVHDTLGVSYSISGLKDLLRRIGASYHKVSGFFWKADVEEQKRWVRKYRRHKRQAGPETRPISWTPATRSGAWTCSIPAGAIRLAEQRPVSQPILRQGNMAAPPMEGRSAVGPR